VYNYRCIQAFEDWGAERWLEAEKNGMAPRLHLQSTHIRALEIVPMSLLKKYAVDLN
jgi:uncharacterized protein (DUF2237 family)